MSGFRRGVDPKEAMGVGLKAHAPAIYRMYIEKWESDREGIKNQMSYEPLEDAAILPFLERIADGKIDPSGFFFTVAEDSKNNKIASLKDYRGKMVRYIHYGEVHMDYAGLMQDQKREYIFLIPK